MTQKEKRLLTVLGTFFMLAVAAVLVLVPYARKWQSYDKVIAERQTRIKNLKRQVANKPALQSEVALMNGLMDASNLFIRATDNASAAANLLSAVKKMIETAGGEISSVNILQNKRQTSENMVAVKVNFIVDNNGMVEVLKNLASSKPLLNVTSARITPMLERKRNVRNDTGKVRLDLVVEAYFASGSQG